MRAAAEEKEEKEEKQIEDTQTGVGASSANFGLNYEALLNVLREEQRRLARAQETIATLRSENRETATQYEVKIDSLRVEKLELTRRIRQLSSQNSYEEVFQTYDADIKRLKSHAEKLQARNVELELQHDMLCDRLRKTSAVSSSASMSASEAVLKMAKSGNRKGSSKQAKQRTSRKKKGNEVAPGLMAVLESHSTDLGLYNATIMMVVGLTIIPSTTFLRMTGVL